MYGDKTMTPVEGKESHPQPKNPVQSRWVVYDSPEHEFSVYYDDQEAKKEYEGRIKQINDDVGTDEYDGDEEVYLAQVISKAEVVQVGIADDGDEGLYRLVAYDCASHSSATSAEKVQIPESEKYVGVSLTLCECGNDTFRLIETADWLFDYEEWEGDDTLRICTKCGKSLGCIHEVRTHKNITRESLAELRAQQKGEQG